MIVIAIIGILAAVAIPQYQSYIARSDAQASLTEARTFTAAIEDYTNRFGILATTVADIKAFTGVETTVVYTADKFEITPSVGSVLVDFSAITPPSPASQLVANMTYTLTACQKSTIVYTEANGFSTCTPWATITDGEELEWAVTDGTNTTVTDTVEAAAYYPKL
jgi:Tfp pilus assembly protein PilE